MKVYGTAVSQQYKLIYIFQKIMKADINGSRVGKPANGTLLSK